jgi:hypothetical protein
MYYILGRFVCRKSVTNIVGRSGSRGQSAWGRGHRVKGLEDWKDGTVGYALGD